MDSLDYMGLDSVFSQARSLWRTGSRTLNQSVKQGVIIGNIASQGTRQKNARSHAMVQGSISQLLGSIDGELGKMVDAEVKKYQRELATLARSGKLTNKRHAQLLGKLNLGIDTLLAARGGAAANPALAAQNRLIGSMSQTMRGGGVGSIYAAAKGFTSEARNYAAMVELSRNISTFSKSLFSKGGIASNLSQGVGDSVKNVFSDLDGQLKNAKTEDERIKVLDNAQTKIQNIGAGASSQKDKDAVKKISEAFAKQVTSYKDSSRERAAQKTGARVNDALMGVAHAAGVTTRAIAHLGYVAGLAVSAFTKVNQVVNRFAKMQMAISRERGMYSRLIRGSGMDFQNLMVALRAGRRAGMDDKQVVDRMASLQEQLALSRWGESSLIEAVGRWGGSPFNERGGVKSQHEMMIEFSRIIKRLGSDMEKFQFLSHIGFKPEQREFVENYEKEAARMSRMRADKSLRGTLEDAQILGESGMAAKIDAATRIELRRREILNQNAIDEGPMAAIKRMLNPENWFFRDWTARQKGVQTAKAEVAQDKLTEAILQLVEEEKKNGGKDKFIVRGLTEEDLAALAHLGDADKANRGEKSHFHELDRLFEERTGLRIDTRETPLERVMAKLERTANKLCGILLNSKALEKGASAAEWAAENPKSAITAALGVVAALLLVKKGLGMFFAWLLRLMGRKILTGVTGLFKAGGKAASTAAKGAEAASTAAKAAEAAKAASTAAKGAEAAKAASTAAKGAEAAEAASTAAKGAEAAKAASTAAKGAEAASTAAKGAEAAKAAKAAEAAKTASTAAKGASPSFWSRAWGGIKSFFGKGPVTAEMADAVSVGAVKAEGATASAASTTAKAAKGAEAASTAAKGAEAASTAAKGAEAAKAASTAAKGAEAAKAASSAAKAAEAAKTAEAAATAAKVAKGASIAGKGAKFVPGLGEVIIAGASTVEAYAEYSQGNTKAGNRAVGGGIGAILGGIGAGMAAGAIAGSPAMGIGAVPGAIIGGVVGLIGAIVGQEVGGAVADEISESLEVQGSDAAKGKKKEDGNLDTMIALSMLPVGGAGYLAAKAGQKVAGGEETSTSTVPPAQPEASSASGGGQSLPPAVPPTGASSTGASSTNLDATNGRLDEIRESIEGVEDAVETETKFIERLRLLIKGGAIEEAKSALAARGLGGMTTAQLKSDAFLNDDRKAHDMLKGQFMATLAYGFRKQYDADIDFTQDFRDKYLKALNAMGQKENEKEMLEGYARVQGITDKVSGRVLKNYVENGWVLDEGSIGYNTERILEENNFDEEAMQKIAAQRAEEFIAQLTPEEIEVGGGLEAWRRAETKRQVHILKTEEAKRRAEEIARKEFGENLTREELEQYAEQRRKEGESAEEAQMRTIGELYGRGGRYEGANRDFEHLLDFERQREYRVFEYKEGGGLSLGARISRFARRHHISKAEARNLIMTKEQATEIADRLERGETIDAVEMERYQEWQKGSDAKKMARERKKAGEGKNDQAILAAGYKAMAEAGVQLSEKDEQIRTAAEEASKYAAIRQDKDFGRKAVMMGIKLAQARNIDIDRQFSAKDVAEFRAEEAKRRERFVGGKIGTAQEYEDFLEVEKRVLRNGGTFEGISDEDRSFYENTQKKLKYAARSRPYRGLHAPEPSYEELVAAEGRKNGRNTSHAELVAEGKRAHAEMIQRKKLNDERHRIEHEEAEKEREARKKAREDKEKLTLSRGESPLAEIRAKGQTAAATIQETAAKVAQAESAAASGAAARDNEKAAEKGNAVYNVTITKGNETINVSAGKEATEIANAVAKAMYDQNVIFIESVRSATTGDEVA